MHKLSTVTDTRSDDTSVSLPEAIRTSQPRSGGLFVPANGSLPIVTNGEIAGMTEATYQNTAETVLGKYDLGLDQSSLSDVIGKAYGEQWHHSDITPVTKFEGQKNLYLLELGHGPTFAFKNVALELLGRFLAATNQETLRALGASSGDTINAAHYAVARCENLRSIFLLPEKGPSEVQMLQALANDIQNAITILASGDFDDAQDAIKLFNKPEYAEFKKENNFISFNSIQILRIIAQVVYYFRAYAQLVKQQAINMGDEIDFSVPSGNFGDALAGHWAREMGLPIRKINVATNANDVLHQFLQTGTYKLRTTPHGRRKRAQRTNAPSQDITISSNFERALYWACDGDTGKVRGWMGDLKKNNEFTVDKKTLTKLQSIFTSSRATDGDILNTRRWAWNAGHTIIEGHTATGVFPFAEKAPDIPTVCLSTSHPIQFSSPHGVPQPKQYGEIVDQFRSRKPQEGVHYLRANGKNVDSIQEAVREAVRITSEGKPPLAASA